MKTKVELWNRIKLAQQQIVREKGERWIRCLLEMSTDLINCNNFEMTSFFSGLVRDTCDYIDPINNSSLAKIVRSDEAVTLNTLYREIHLCVEYDAMLAAEKEDKKMEREKARAESAQREADLAMKTLKEKQSESKIRVAKRRSKNSKFTMRGGRGAKFFSEMGEFEKQDDDSDDEDGASGAVTSTDANEEEVDDIGNGCGDYYDDSTVKADSWDKRKKGKSRFKKKQEMGEQRKAKNFLPEPSDKVKKA